MNMSKTKLKDKIYLSEQELKLFRDQAPMATIEWDTDFQVLNWNSAAEKMFGYTVDEVRGQYFVDIMLPESAVIDVEQIWKDLMAQTGGEVSINENLTKDGRIILCEWRNTAIKDDTGKVIGAASIVQDITEKKRLHDQLNLSTQQLKLFREQAPMATIEWDTDFQVVNWNSAAEKMFGYTVDEVRGQYFVDIMLPESAVIDVEQIWKDLMAQSGGEVSINENLTKDGRIILCEWRNTAIKDDTGKVIGAASIVQDITEREREQQRLKQSHDQLEKRVKERTLELAAAVDAANKANEIKSQFLANISHELRTPMHGILSFANFGITKSDTATREKLHDYFSNIQLSGRRLLALLNDLLDLSKLEAGKMELTIKDADLVAVVEICHAEQKQRIKDLGLKLILNKPSYSVVGQFDPIRVGQIVTNLLSNAIKFSPMGKQITIIVDLNDQQTMTFSIHNQGLGIPEDELEEIFDAFIQSSKAHTGAGGTGLGLAISKEIIDLHGGQIWCENSPEGGVIFRFTIPSNH